MIPGKNRPNLVTMRLLVIACIYLAVSFNAVAEDFQIGLPDAERYGMSNFYISASDGSGDREVVLLVFLSPLGSALKKRSPTSREMSRIRAACEYMVDLFRASAAGEPDDYFIEFADGPAPPEKIHPDRRTVFGFEAERGCNASPQTINVS